MNARSGRLALVATALLGATEARAAPVRGGPPVVYLAMGDSTAVGVGAPDGGGYPLRLARRLEAAGVAARLTLVAASGATAADVLREQLPRVQAARPTLVTIGIGLNDVMQGRKLADFARDLEILADFVRRTKATVVILTLPDVSLSPSARGAPPSLSRRVEAFNATIARVAERHGFVVADVWGATRRGLRERGEELFGPDGFHPSAAGYELWADAVWPALEAAAVTPRVQARRPGAR